MEPIAVTPKLRVRYALSVVKEATPRRLRRSVFRAGLRASVIGRKGSAVGCPVCGSESAAYVRNRCPVCSAAARHRLVALFMRRELKIEETPTRLLHFAPEPALIPMLEGIPTVDYVPADLRPDKGHEQVDATAITLAPDFDGVLMSHVLEHIPDDRRAMAEIFRVLKPGGWAMLLVPIDEGRTSTYEDGDASSSWARMVNYGQQDHVRIYSPDFVDRVRAAGFEVEERRYADEVPADEAQRFGFLTSDIIFLCRKPAS